MMNEQALKKLLVVGAKIELGEEYCKDSYRFSPGEVITLAEGWFEYENGLYTEDQSAPSIYDPGNREFDSIYHLFGNNFEKFSDCKVITDQRDSIIDQQAARIAELENTLRLVDQTPLDEYYSACVNAAVYKALNSAEPLTSYNRNSDEALGKQINVYDQQVDGCSLYEDLVDLQALNNAHDGSTEVHDAIAALISKIDMPIAAQPSGNSGQLPTTGDGQLIEEHQHDKCDKCGSHMNMTRTRYEADGYDYLHWLCTNDNCLDSDDRHEYHKQHDTQPREPAQ